MLYYAPVQNLIEIPNKKDKSIKKTKSAENGSFEILKKITISTTNNLYFSTITEFSEHHSADIFCGSVLWTTYKSTYFTLTFHSVDNIKSFYQINCRLTLPNECVESNIVTDNILLINNSVQYRSKSGSDPRGSDCHIVTAWLCGTKCLKTACIYHSYANHF